MLFSDLVHRVDQVQGDIERRQTAFNLVRDIPYGTIGAHEPKLALKNQTADCYAKSQILSQLLAHLGYETRILIMQYRLKNKPEEVMYIPGQLDYHYALQLKLNDHWVTIDATYDPPLAKLGFIVNNWNGNHSTPLTESPLSQKIYGQPDVRFDAAFQSFQQTLEAAYLAHLDKINLYQIKFNEWLESARK